MVVINYNSGDSFFTLNGKKYTRVYQAVAQGEDHVAIYNVHDIKNQLLSTRHYSDVQVNGIYHTSQDTLLQTLIPILYQRSGSDSTGTGDSTDWQAKIDLKEDKFNKNTAFNKNFGSGSGQVAEGNDPRFSQGSTAFGWGDHSVIGYLTDETTTQLNEPVLSGNILTLKFLNENEVEQTVSVDLSSLATSAQGLSNATYDAAQNLITLTEDDGSQHTIDLSELSIISTTDANGITTLKQEVDDAGTAIVKLTVSKVGQTGQWSDILGKPSTFPPSAHTHPYDNYSHWIIKADDGGQENILSGTPIAFRGSGGITTSYNAVNNDLFITANITWDSLTGKPTVFPAEAHNHDDRYYTETESDNRFSLIGHTHNYDNYGGWVIKADDSNSETITANTPIAFRGGTGLTTSYNAVNNDLFITPTFGTTAGTFMQGDWRPTWDDVSGKPAYDNYGGWTIKADDSNSELITSNTPITFRGSGGITTSYNSTNNDLFIQANITWDSLTGKPTVFPPEAHTHDYDKYGYWTIKGNTGSENITTGTAIVFNGTNGITTAYNSTNNDLFITPTYGTAAGTFMEGSWRPTWSDVTGKPTLYSGWRIGVDGTNLLDTIGDKHGIHFIGTDGLSTSYDASTNQLTISGSGITSYTGWTISADSGGSETVGSGTPIVFRGGTGISTSYNAVNNDLFISLNAHTHTWSEITDKPSFYSGWRVADASAVYDTISDNHAIKFIGGTGITTSYDATTNEMTINNTSSGYSGWKVGIGDGVYDTVGDGHVVEFIGGTGITTSYLNSHQVQVSLSETYDNYGHWKLGNGDGTYQSITSGNGFNIVGSGGTTITRSGSTITVDSSTGGTYSWKVAADDGVYDIVGSGHAVQFIGGTGITTSYLNNYQVEISADGAYDNYGHWKLGIGDGTYHSVGSTYGINLLAGSGIGITRSGSSVTISNTGGSGSDSYGGWRLGDGDGTYDTIGSNHAVNFIGGTYTTTSYDPTTNEMTINNTAPIYTGWRIADASASYDSIGSNHAVKFVGGTGISTHYDGATNTMTITNTGGSGTSDGNSYHTAMSLSSSTGVISLTSSNGAPSLSVDLDTYVVPKTGGTFSGNIYAPKFYQSSLRSLKTNIETYRESALDMVNGLNIVEFDYKAGETNNVGVIAEDTHEDFLSTEKDAVNLYNSNFINAKAIQELSAKVESQQKEIEELKMMVQQLMSK